mgnify:CR=1 FL=1
MDTLFGLAGGAKVSALADNAICQGRLTLTTVVPVTTADVTAATTVYFTPFRGNQVALFNGSKWKRYPFTEFSIPVPATTNTNYDFFLRDQSAYPYPQVVAWSSDTARASAISLKNGVYTLTDDPRLRYLGSFRTTGTSGQTEDSGDRGSLVEAKRYLWNYYNRVPRRIRISDTTNSWTYTTNTHRSWNNNTANRVSFVIGVSETPLFLTFTAMHYDNSSNSAAVGVGIDSTSVNSAGIFPSHNNVLTAGAEPSYVMCVYNGIITAGYHYAQLLEIGQGGATTTTWWGDNNRTWSQSGAVGWIMG